MGLEYMKIQTCPNDLYCTETNLMHWMCVQRVGYHDLKRKLMEIMLMKKKIVPPTHKGVMEPSHNT